jgi:hypothetical protein
VQLAQHATRFAFWDDEDAANPDHEVLIALRAAMASVSGRDV